MDEISYERVYGVVRQILGDHLRVDVSVDRDTEDEVQVKVALYLGGELISESEHRG